MKIKHGRCSYHHEVDAQTWRIQSGVVEVCGKAEAITLPTPPTQNPKSAPVFQIPRLAIRQIHGLGTAVAWHGVSEFVSVRLLKSTRYPSLRGSWFLSLNEEKRIELAQPYRHLAASFSPDHGTCKRDFSYANEGSCLSLSAKVRQTWTMRRG